MKIFGKLTERELHPSQIRFRKIALDETTPWLQKKLKNNETVQF